MAATVGGIASRRRRREAASKERRQKIILAVGGVLLLGILAFEGPKTLAQLRGTSAAPVVTGQGRAPGRSLPGVRRAKGDPLARIKRLPAKDPFVAQLAPLGQGGPPAFAAGRPVRTTRFVSKDPFVPQLGAEPAAAGAAGAAGAAPPSTAEAPTSSGAAGTSGYAVVLASIDKADGRAQARDAAAAARAAGLGGVKVVDSDSYGTLRSGFYAVVSGPYRSLPGSRQALAAARANGYISAYSRRLGN